MLGPESPFCTSAGIGGPGERGERVDLCVTTVDAVSDVPAADWDALAADSLYSCHRWLTFVERDTTADCRYVTVERNGQLVAGLPLYRVLDEENEFYDPKQLVDGRWQGSYLIAGARRGYVNTFPVSSALPDHERGHVLDALLSQVERESAAAGEDALLLYMPSHTCDELARLRPGVAPLLTSMDAHLALPGSGFDDYLAALRKQSRTNARREIAAFRAADVVTGLERIGDCCDEAAPLLAQLQARYGHAGPEDHYRRMLRRHAEALDDMSLVVTARRGGRLAAFALFYLWRSTMYLRLAGFDYPLLTGAFEYFNVAFYLPIDWAYAHGFDQLHLGRESFEAKLRRGAKLRPMLSAALPATSVSARESASAWNRVQLTHWQSATSAPSLDGTEWLRWAS
jgi:predicted N-acyltransferase